VCCTYTWIWIACSLYKLVPKVKYFHCCQMFAINKPIMHLILQEFVYAMNIVFILREFVYAMNIVWVNQMLLYTTQMHFKNSEKMKHNIKPYVSILPSLKILH
jgi:hypothetical protein